MIKDDSRTADHHKIGIQDGKHNFMIGTITRLRVGKESQEYKIPQEHRQQNEKRDKPEFSFFHRLHSFRQRWIAVCDYTISCGPINVK